MKENTVMYYQWWIRNQGIYYVPHGKFIPLLKTFHEKEEEEEWVLRAASRCIQYCKHEVSIQTELNRKARISGREAELRVSQYLENKGWQIVAKPSEELYPKFGTSTVGYDICASFRSNLIKVEVKTTQSPLFTISPKSWGSINKGKADYLAFVKGDEIWFTRIKDIVFDEPIYQPWAFVHPRPFRHLLVVKQSCLLKAV
jgi:Holliday junction resolvase-like predicted endonuclease